MAFCPIRLLNDESNGHTVHDKCNGHCYSPCYAFLLDELLILMERFEIRRWDIYDSDLKIKKLIDCNKTLSKKAKGKRFHIRALEEKLAFVRKWTAVPGEASCAGDIVLCTADGSRFSAHRFVLASKSNVFKTMLEVDLREKRSGEVLIHEVGGEALKVFLKFLYTAKLSAQHMRAHFRELVKLGHLYEVSLLLLKLDRFLSRRLMVKKNAIEMFAMADMYDLKKTKKAAKKIIAGWPLEKFTQAIDEAEMDPAMVWELQKSTVDRITQRFERNFKLADAD